MYTFKDVLKKNEFSQYDFGTGIWPIINKDIEMRLNDNGEYVNYFNKEISEYTEKELEKLKATNMIFCEKNEDSVSKELFFNTPDIKYNNKLGYYLGSYVGHVLEGNYRENASSGGFGTWIFKELLEKGYIDGVIHVVKNNSNKALFKYSISRTVEEISNGAKTRYYPVELSEVLQIVKKNPGKYAVIGLPSYVMDIRLLAESDPIFKDRIKFVIGLVCGHQKSQQFADFLAWQCGVEPGTLETINFRKKIDGLSSTSYGIEVTGIVNGTKQTIVKNTKDLYGYDWGKGFFKVRASDYTDDVMNETADVTLGDAWLPKYTKDSGGNNIIVIRNPIIQKIFIDALKEKRIKLDIVDEDTIIQSQSSHYKHTQDELKYRLYKKEKNEEWYPKKRTLPSNQLPSFRRKVQDLREEMCLSAPIYYKEAVEKNDFSYFVKKMKPMVKAYDLIYFYERVKRKVIKTSKKISGN